MYTFTMTILVYFTILSKAIVIEVIASLQIMDKGVIPLVEQSVGIQFYVDVENRNRLFPCTVKYWTRQCRYTDPDKTDPTDIAVYGALLQIVKLKDRETFFYVYPAIIQENQKGLCNFVFDYKCGNFNKSIREEVSIPFDTRTKRTSGILSDFAKSSTCASIDQDVKRNCEPVNCDLKYIGKKYFYNDSVNKCVTAPICNEDRVKELPDIVYDPRSNTCKDLESPLSIADVYAITSGLGVVKESLKFNNDLSMQLQSNCNTISENFNFLKDMMYGKLYPSYHSAVPDFSMACKTAIKTILLSILLLSFIILAFTSCISVSIWTLKKVSRGDLSKFFNTIQSKLKKRNYPKCNSKQSTVNKDIKNKLLKDVIVTDLPIELRDSFENLCERINKEVKWKKRYRRGELGSTINLAKTSGMLQAISAAAVRTNADNK